MKCDRPNNHGKTFKTPRRPFDKERLDKELKVCGEFGLKNKRELWRVQLLLSNIRKAARLLLTLEEKDQKRMFEGDALLRRLTQLGLLTEENKQLDYVLQLTVNDFLERRLQTNVYKSGIAKSLHHARVLVRQGHIGVRNKKVNVPSFMVRVDSERYVDYLHSSPFGANGRPGRVARKKRSGGDD